MTKVSESYIVGFDLNDVGNDVSVASICQFNIEKQRYEMVKTLYGEDAESLYDRICSDQLTRVNIPLVVSPSIDIDGRQVAKRLINQIYGLSSQE